MTANLDPLTELKRLSYGKATGEFICAAGAQEIHVYLQQGRIAWATASAHPFEFARYIKEHGNIDDDALREVVAECRRKKLPFGETLVAWEFVGWDDVRAALHHQARLALEQLGELDGAQMMFLERKKFAEYNPGLTLDLASILPEVVPDAGAPEPDALPMILPEASGSVTHPRAIPPPEGAGRSRQVLEAVRGAVWVEVLDGTRPREASPPWTRESRIPAALVQSTLNDGADFVAIRSALGTLIGTRVAQEGGDLWCALGTEANYGIALSTLRSLGMLRGDGHGHGHGLRTTPAAGPGGDRAWTVGPRSESSAELQLVLDGGREVLAALVLGRGGEPRAGVARGAVERAGCLALLARRAAIFSDPDPIRPDWIEGPDLAPLGCSSRMILTGEPDVWCFSAELPGDRGETVWLLTDRTALQGIGWACLATLIRGVGGDRHEERLGRAAAT